MQGQSKEVKFTPIEDYDQLKALAEGIFKGIEKLKQKSKER